MAALEKTGCGLEIGVCPAIDKDELVVLSATNDLSGFAAIGESEFVARELTILAMPTAKTMNATNPRNPKGDFQPVNGSMKTKLTSL